VSSEADFYNRRAQDRSYLGEGLNGVTRDWTIVDVPPGTQRVRLDGVGGATQEITWQRYNGVRRSKFIAPGETYEDRSGRRFHGGRNGHGDVWTEITRDLVVREALDELGYEYEETEFFFYVIEYLRYVSLGLWILPYVLADSNDTRRRMFSSLLNCPKTSAASAVNVSIRSSGKVRGGDLGRVGSLNVSMKSSMRDQAEGITRGTECMEDDLEYCTSKPACVAIQF
jgi:hypothetical protein